MSAYYDNFTKVVPNNKTRGGSPVKRKPFLLPRAMTLPSTAQPP